MTDSAAPALRAATIIAPRRRAVEFMGDRLALRRDIDEIAHLQIAWDIEGVGQFVGTTATLMERIPPYHLLIELARGKINEVRNQLAEWESVGLQIAEPVSTCIQRATKTFGQALLEVGGAEANRLAGQALRKPIVPPSNSYKSTPTSSSPFVTSA